MSEDRQAPERDRLERAKAGDGRAFDEFLGPVLDPAFRLAITMLKDRGAAEDAVQEAALKAWRKLGRFRSGAELRPWFLAIVANECRTVRRGRWWSVLRFPQMKPASASDATWADRMDLHAALDRLPQRHLLALTLYYHLDLPIDGRAGARVLGRWRAAADSPGAGGAASGDGGRGGRMTPDERDLKRALEARSGAVSPEFRRRLSGAFQEGGPAANAMPAIALVAVIVLSVASIGILLMSRQAGPVKQAGPVSSARLGSPWPGHLFLPQTAEISAPSGNVVWVYFAQGFLFRSTDRGDTWEQRPLPVNQPGVSPWMSFVDAKNGWYSTSGSPETQCNAQDTQIWHTSDGGATWQMLGTTGIAPAQCKEGLSFIDATHGFLAAWDDNHQPTIYRTSDGGRTWMASTLPDPPGFMTQGAGVALRAELVKGFGSTLLVAATDGQGAEHVFHSLDGGATWSYLAPVNPGVGNVVFVTASRWLQMQNESGGSETTDAGKKWHSFPNDYTDAAGIVSFFFFGDAHVGYGTVRGSIHRTVDGGVHWTGIKTPGT